MNMIKLSFSPRLIEFVSVKSSFQPLLAVTELDSATLRIVKTEQPLIEKKSESAQVIYKEKQNLHDAPITFIKFNGSEFYPYHGLYDYDAVGELSDAVV